jgi:predicted secreted hydrolase
MPSFADETTWLQVQPGVEFHFPRDHGSHPNYQTEWWYVTGQVADEKGNEFGYQFTIFRFGIIHETNDNDANLTPQHLLAGHLAIADINKQTFTKAERIRRAGAGFAEASETELHSWIGDWDIQQDDKGVITISAADQDKGISIQFTLTPEKDPIFHGDHGYSQKGEEVGNASAYYSWTRLKTNGQLTIQDQTFKVHGDSWFDHEYGSSQLGDDTAGWDWFGLHLDDGSELMLYQLRKKEGGAIPQSSATIVNADGESIQINQEDWSLLPLSYWTSKETKAKYPIQWRLQIPSHHIDMTIQAKVNQSEMVTNESTNVTYWEGPVGISGSHSGSGYMELTGYADIFSKTF